MFFNIFLVLQPGIADCQNSFSKEKFYADYELDYYPSFIKWPLNGYSQDKMNDSGEFSYVLNKIVRSCSKSKFQAYIFPGIGKHLTGVMPKEMAENPWMEISITNQGMINKVRVYNNFDAIGFNDCIESVLKDSILNPGLLNAKPVNCVLIYILKS